MYSESKMPGWGSTAYLVLFGSLGLVSRSRLKRFSNNPISPTPISGARVMILRRLRRSTSDFKSDPRWDTLLRASSHVCMLEHPNETVNSWRTPDNVPLY